MNHSRHLLVTSWLVFALFCSTAATPAGAESPDQATSTSVEPSTTTTSLEASTTTTTTTTLPDAETEPATTTTTTTGTATTGPATIEATTTTTAPTETTTTTSIELPELGNNEGDVSEGSVPEDVADLKPDALQFPELTNLLVPVLDPNLLRAITDLEERIPALTDQISSLTTQWQQAALDNDRLRAEIGMLDYARKNQTETVAAAQTTLRNKALQLYLDGGSRESGDFIGLFVDEPSVYMQRHVTTQIVVDHDRAQIEQASGVVSQADRAIRDLASELAQSTGRLESLRRSINETIEERDAAEKELAVRRAAGVFSDIRGFVFPVPPPVKYWDDWGQPRSGGRSHQGNDLIAPWGTPIVAVEAGVIARIGENELGGSILWLKGLSGTSYYYAHLGQYAPGMVPGTPVVAGTVIAFVGQTGNARFSVPHLHFEVHPNSGSAVDPYPLLRASYEVGSVPAMPPDLARPTDPSAPVSIPTPTTTTTTTVVPVGDMSSAPTPSSG